MEKNMGENWQTENVTDVTNDEEYGVAKRSCKPFKRITLLKSYKKNWKKEEKRTISHIALWEFEKTRCKFSCNSEFLILSLVGYRRRRVVFMPVGHFLWCAYEHFCLHKDGDISRRQRMTIESGCSEIKS